MNHLGEMPQIKRSMKGQINTAFSLKFILFLKGCERQIIHKLVITPQ